MPTSNGTGRQRSACDDRADAEFDAEPPLHQVAQYKSGTDREDAGRRHDAGRDRNKAWAVGCADRPHMPDHPVGRGNRQAEQHKKNGAFDVFSSLVVDHDRFDVLNFANPCARNWQAGHLPQP